MNPGKKTAVIAFVLLVVLGAGGALYAQEDVNKVFNSGLEADKNGKNQDPKGWSTLSTNDGDADFCESGWTHSGDYKLTHWKDKAFEVFTWQEITGLARGTYNLEFWYASGDGLIEGYVELKGYGGEPVRVPLPASGSWTRSGYDNIEITSGHATLGVYSKANAGYWINLDDFLLFDQANPPVVAMKNYVNLLKNPDFEEGTDRKADGWTIQSDKDADAAYRESGWAHSGGYKLTNWKDKPYKVYAYQTISDLANGTYALEYWYANGGLQNDCYVEIKDHGGNVVREPLSISGKWIHVKIPDIRVSTGKCTVGLFSDAGANYWINIDDMAFYPDTEYAGRDKPVFTTQPGQLAVRGADLSTLPLVEAAGGKFYDFDNSEKDILQILKSNGMNAVRLRTWYKPANGICGKEATLAMAKRVKEAGMQLMIDFHYSDTWADPGKQYKPADWEGLGYIQLCNAVYGYTYDIISSLKKQGTMPDMVQIGNEVTAGMIWPEGKIGSSGWTNFAGLVSAGIRGAREAAGKNSSMKIMIHIDKGGDNAAAVWFYDNLIREGVDFDIIGLSYYVFWHGKPAALQQNLDDLAKRYGKEIIVAELAFPFTLEDARGEGNIVSTEDILRSSGYTATISGQQEYLSTIKSLISHTAGGKGLGFFYWEPAWLDLPGTGWDPADPESGDGWENQGLFNFEGYPLKSLSVFNP